MVHVVLACAKQRVLIEIMPQYCAMILGEPEVVLREIGVPIPGGPRYDSNLYFAAIRVPFGGTRVNERRIAAVLPRQEPHFTNEPFH